MCSTSLTALASACLLTSHILQSSMTSVGSAGRRVESFAVVSDACNAATSALRAAKASSASADFLRSSALLSSAAITALWLAARPARRLCTSSAVSTTTLLASSRSSLNSDDELISRERCSCMEIFSVHNLTPSFCRL